MTAVSATIFLGENRALPPCAFLGKGGGVDISTLSIVIQLAGVAATAGIVWRASKEHDRRLETLEKQNTDHERRIATIEGRCEMAEATGAGC